MQGSGKDTGMLRHAVSKLGAHILVVAIDKVGCARIKHQEGYLARYR